MNESILVTGASGYIGSRVCAYFRQLGYEVIGYDRVVNKQQNFIIQGDINDFEKLCDAAKKASIMIHLAACPDDADFKGCLVPENVLGLYHAMEAARLEGIQNVIFASSCRVANLVHAKSYIGVDDRYPTDFYGLTKLWGEDMLKMYSSRYGINALGVRLGWVIRNKQEKELMCKYPEGRLLYLSENDMLNFFHCAVKARPSCYATVYALSRQCNGELFEMSYSRELIGFEPTDMYVDE